MIPISNAPQFPLPPRAPVMVLPEVTLFPHALVPLFIFEPRYRAMLAWALERERMFCLAMLRPGITQFSGTQDFHQVAGIGLVRACVEHEDGTSHLVLQGVARVRFTGFEQESPFPLAELAEMADRRAVPEAGKTLRGQLLGLCARFRAEGVSIPEELDQQLASVAELSVLTDVVAHTFVRDADQRQELLAESDVEERLRALVRHLTRQLTT